MTIQFNVLRQIKLYLYFFFFYLHEKSTNEKSGAERVPNF